MTVGWTLYAQSKTDKIVKGMLTGPVTMLNWSFVREDIPRETVMRQMALAIFDEVADLQAAGIKIIQVDEAAFKEGYPLRREKRAAYEKMAVDAFRLAVLPAESRTQIHTHMCYSDFTDIMPTIEAMDADVITIETSRNGNVLLEAFKAHGYQKEVGPGVYDIHSPRVPDVAEMEAQITALLEVLPVSQLWINPDCGLKTRKYDEVVPSLKNMVQAVRNVREVLN
jgi:5-methyltetrahydropteroyltriglutamate--homocysteine methyltransferase